jgi:hypothetical protein
VTSRRSAGARSACLAPTRSLVGEDLRGIDRQSPEQPSPRGEFADYVRALQRIALGKDSSVSARDRLTALRELLKLEKRGTTSYIDGNPRLDKLVRKRWAETDRINQLQLVKLRERRLGIPSIDD